MKTPIFRGNFGYVFWAILLILFFVLRIVSPNVFSQPFVFLLFSLPLLFLPGNLIASFFKVGGSVIEKILLWFLLSLGFYFLIGTILFIFKANINVYFWLNLILIFILLFLNIAIHLNQRAKFDFKFNLKCENIYFLVPIFLILFFLIVLAGHGPEINGDTYFHLSIIRKAFEGKSFGARELYLTKLSDLNPAYLIPVWHTFLAFLAKVFRLDILVCWQNLILPLFIIAVLSWYYLAKKIFDHQFASILGLSLFLVFYFNGTGYIFARLLVPDTFCQLILFPLGLAFAIAYFFEGQKKNLFAVLLVSLLLLLIHPPHYFYLLLFVFGFLIGAWLISLFNKNFKNSFFNVLKVVGLMLLPLVLALIILSFNSGLYSLYLDSFLKQSSFPLSYNSFSKFPLAYKFSYFILPIALVLNRKYLKRSLIIFLLLALTPLIYFTPLEDIFSRFLSLIFTDRLLVNTSLYFLVFTLLILPFLSFFNQKINSLEKKKRDIWDLITFALVAMILMFQFTTGIVGKLFYLLFYGKTTFNFVNENLLIFWGLVAAISICLIFFKKNFRDEKIEKNYSTMLIFALMIFMFFTPSFEYLPLKKILNLASLPKSTSKDYFLPIIDNNQKFLTNINNLPSDSVVMAGPAETMALAVLSRQYVAYVPGLSWEKNLMMLYDPNSSDSLINTVLLNQKYGLNYLVVQDQDSQIQRFLNNPHLELIDKNNLNIFKVIK